MLERGAPWKNELAFGQPVVEVLTSELASLRARHSAVPEEMEKILAKYGAETSRP